MALGANVQVRFTLKRWSVWEPTALGANAEIPEVPALLRRRASQADRAALRVAFDCAVPGPSGPGLLGPCPAVFCSRHGEVRRSVELLEQLSKAEAMSPMTFSLSVHNSAAALYSLTRGDTSPMSALAAGRDSLHQGLLEASAMLTDGADEVLVVAYDDTLPEAFKSYRDDNDAAYSLGLLLGRVSLRTGSSRSYSLDLIPGSQAASGKLQAQQVAQFLKADLDVLEIASAPRHWIWRKI